MHAVTTMKPATPDIAVDWIRYRVVAVRNLAERPTQYTTSARYSTSTLWEGAGIQGGCRVGHFFLMLQGGVE